MFHLVGSLVLSYSALHCLDSSGLSADTAHLHLFHLVIVAHLVQILLTSVPGAGCICVCLLTCSSSIIITRSFWIPSFRGGAHIQACNNVSSHLKPLSFPWESNKLIDVPEDYCALINQAFSFTCPKSDGVKS
ncbi:E3 ubiquitin-protein ligase UBR2-like [Ictalurus punctatus]|uniref:E3 ubiquitin-protein ligase UBR2-like n=1 Tax=Ictalurus punctatus TaxID=7998 RepID=A0A9F7R2J2_ICTPU|nr:E3 ubiquitin-protein ligase UBR2-like [Ictalurus punctatus]XP_053534896.1 E3 ubiquitin-protein ligase UBR2-like [Ictalurus punctatus]